MFRPSHAARARRAVFFPLLSALALAVLGAACITQVVTSTATPGPPQTPIVTGILAGTVTFIGAPCPPGNPDNRTPPCDGPYPGYSVEIYEADKTDGQPLATAITSEAGTYALSLAAGEYVIYTQNGIRPEDRAENRVTLIPEQVNELNMTVDTGIR